MSFAELVAATAFSFLRGAAQPSDMVAEAVRLGHDAIGIADRNTVAGVVRAYSAIKKANEELAEEKLPPLDFRLLVGARLVFADGTPDVVAYPATRAGWGRLTRLLTQGNLRAKKGGCILRLEDLIGFADEQMLIVLPESSYDADAVTAYRGENVVPKGEPDNVISLASPRRRPGPPRNEILRHQAAPASAGATVFEMRKRERGTGLGHALEVLASAAPGRVWLGASPRHNGRDRRRLARLAQAARHAGVPLLATNAAMYATEDDRPLHDVMACIRLGASIHRVGRALAPNAEAHLKSADEMARLFADWPEALAEPMRLVERVQFTLDQLAYEYPREPVPKGWEPQSWLEHITWEAAHARHPEGVPEKLKDILAEEFALIRDRNYACYFLTVHDLVKFARSVDPPILCQGRGSAANSAVCFLLGVTSIDPMQYDLLFSRFVSEERDEPPDIDVDFEHERREEVMQYIYRRYGRHRAGIAATVIHYRPRSAVREVGKALGFSEDVTARLAATIWGSFASRMEEKRFAESGFDVDNPDVARLRMVVDRLLEFPRHLSQHVGGYVLTQDRLDETVPIHNGAMENRTFIEWDKDDIDALKLMKVDVLALGMLTCIQKSFDLMRRHGLGDHTLEVDLDTDDPAVFDMLCEGDSVGVFQVESRAQMNMLPRLKPRTLYDLTVQVAIVRPGPIAGDMVHPYLKRRSGKEKVEFPSPSPPHDPDELRGLLGLTYGVPLFQEQAMKLAIVAAEFTPGEANRLRRAMATFRNVGGMHDFKEKLVEGMARRGYSRDFAERCYQQIEGFGSYGFPESHALSFARLVYVSSWIKCHHPAVFCAAILNSQPMGFYAPAQLVKDAENHGVEVRAIDVNASGWDNGLESLVAPAKAGVAELKSAPSQPGPGLRRGDVFSVRLGLRQIDGFQQEWAEPLIAARNTAQFASVEDLARRANLPPRALRLLADADAFRSLGLDRRAALWDARRTPQGELPLFAAADARELSDEGERALPVMPLAEQVATDYQTMRLSLKGHPMGFLRPLFRAEGVASAAGINGMKDGARAAMAGVVLVRQRPGKGNAIFVTLEDETGVVNLVLWARTFEAYRRQVMASRLMLAHGIVQRSEEGVIHLMTERVIDRSAELARLTRHGIVEQELSRADTFKHPIHRTGHPRDVRILPGSRDFH